MHMKLQSAVHIRVLFPTTNVIFNFLNFENIHKIIYQTFITSISVFNILITEENSVLDIDIHGIPEITVYIYLKNIFILLV